MELVFFMDNQNLNPGSDVFMHVDDFIETHPSAEIQKQEPHINYARFVLNLFRLPAHMLTDFQPYIKDSKLYCYSNIDGLEGKKLQVVFASRMGWIGVKDPSSTYHSYENSVPINRCFKWSTN